MPSTWNYLHLHWINLHRNDFVPKRPATSVSTCCLANSSWKSYTLHPLNSVSFGKALHRRETLPNKIHSVSTLNITQEECEKPQRVQAEGRELKGEHPCFLLFNTWIQWSLWITCIVNDCRTISWRDCIKAPPTPLAQRNVGLGNISFWLYKGYIDLMHGMQLTLLSKVK